MACKEKKDKTHYFTSLSGFLLIYLQQLEATRYCGNFIPFFPAPPLL
jgi:hypothetical protein